MTNVRIAPRSTSISWLTRAVLQQDTTLRLGHASAMLILERWDLSRILAATPATGPEKAAFISSFTVFSARLVASRAMEVLTALKTLTAAHGTITPMYDTLLGTYAGVTLAQFADLLGNVCEAVKLMQQVDRQRNSRMRSREPVLTWATNMMEKKSLDVEAAGPRHTEASLDQWAVSQGRSTLWVPTGVVDWVDANAQTN